MCVCVTVCACVCQDTEEIEEWGGRIAREGERNGWWERVVKDYVEDKKTHTTVFFLMLSPFLYFSEKHHYTKNIPPNNLDVKGLKL